ncbi:MAG: hypothetical protein JOZ49_19240 [Mycolicibacterium sp.]|nr:hypothetical protein [Mycolicibacterium sp.]
MATIVRIHLGPEGVELWPPQKGDARDTVGRHRVDPELSVSRAARRLQSRRLDAYMAYMLIAVLAVLAVVIATS